jgi:hypothetical protein
MTQIDNIPLEARRRGGKRGGGHSRGKGAGIRFLREHVSHQGTDCLKWPLKGSNGYGVFGYMGETHYAHRYMCELVNGPAPSPDHEAAHSCGRGQHGCVNPRHLSWKTKSENQADRAQHGTKASGPRGKITQRIADDIRDLAGHVPQREIAERFGVSRANVSLIINGKTWNGGHSRWSKLTDDQVRAIRAEAGRRYAKDVAKDFGVHESTIHRIMSRKGWAHVPDRPTDAS